MYELDLTGVKEKNIYPLGKAFFGRSPGGREIGFTNYYMTMDGKPFFAVSGEMHFCRVSPDQWEDAVVKMRCCGVNILSSYVFWIVHEEEEGVFRFDGCRDLRAFLSVCEKHGMYVIVRLGPFAHGEMRNGGLPDWLFGKPYDVREDDPGFLSAVRRFYRAVHGQMDGHYFGQGGCVIGAQIDNEYGHSGAPWEMTAGASREWVPAGRSGLPYMRKLRAIMREEGIRVPFYTATAWGGAAVPAEDTLPLWGGYSYQPWLFYEKEGVHPATPEYIYRDNHNSLIPETYNFEPAYDPESRPYACCEMMGGMTCSYRYRFLLDMRAVDALANIKLGSGCNMPGYYMFRGGTTPLGKRTPYLNEGQVPNRSYDYQAPVGEFGQIRESYGRLRAVHMFCRLFSGFFETTKAVLPAHLSSVRPDDSEPLRFSVRVQGSRGFLFICNFQDHAPMRDRSAEEVRLLLPDGPVTFRFGIAAGENAILPFGLEIGTARLRWASAQPLARAGDTWFFFCPDGMRPAYAFEDRTIEPGPGEAFAAGGQLIVTLSRQDAQQFWLCGGTAYLCDRPLLWDGERLYAEIEEGAASLRVWSDARRRFVPFLRIEHPFPPEPLPLRKTGDGRYTVSVPARAFTGHKRALLRVRFRGDTGRAFAGNELISDHFFAGDFWDIRLDPYAQVLKKEPLTILITPVRTRVTVDVSQMAGLREEAEKEEAELLSAELVLIDDYPVTPPGPAR